MDDVSQSDARDPAQHDRWVASWREAVLASSAAVGLVELESHRFLALSQRAAELLGTTPDQAVGLDYLSVAERPSEAALTIRLVVEGMLDAIQARRRFGRPDGSFVEVRSSGWAIRSRSGPDLGLWVAEVLDDPESAAVSEDLVAEIPERLVALDIEAASLTVGTLDSQWRVAQLSTDAERLLGRPPSDLIGASIVDLAHPDNTATLLVALARATAEVNADARLRLRHRDGSWRNVTAILTMLPGGPAPRFAFVLSGAEEPGAETRPDRVDRLERLMRRIAAEVQAAGLLPAADGGIDLLGLPGMSELSSRQWEVVLRIARAERVPTIAREMYLSQSTVRNHLAAIFRKVGVHSQQELIALLRSAQSFDPPTET
jgi:PAS domain S-box-containing protein